MIDNIEKFCWLIFEFEKWCKFGVLAHISTHSVLIVSCLLFGVLLKIPFGSNWQRWFYPTHARQEVEKLREERCNLKLWDDQKQSSMIWIYMSTQDSSHHQDYYIFRIGNPCKLYTFICHWTPGWGDRSKVLSSFVTLWWWKIPYTWSSSCRLWKFQSLVKGCDMLNQHCTCYEYLFKVVKDTEQAAMQVDCWSIQLMHIA